MPKKQTLLSIQGHYMLQKIFLTFLLVQSTGILIATHVPDPQSCEDRVTWRHVPLSQDFCERYESLDFY